MRVFVTGTDTGIGKTVVSAWLCRHLRAQYWKPIQSGLDAPTDSATVAALAEVTVLPEAYRLTAPLSPHIAAARDGVRIALERIVAPSVPRLIIEGAGGVFVPINEDLLMLDCIGHIAAPVIVVARTTLGTINHTCLTLEALRARAVPTLGVVMVGEANDDNRRAIERYGDTNVLATLPRLAHIDAATIAAIPLPRALRIACEGRLEESH